MARSAGKEKRESERQCAVTRLRLPPGALLRFALDPDGNAVPDLKAKLPGRGVWITCSREIVDKAIASNVFDRGFRKSVKTPNGLAGQVEALLERDALQRLSLANKAGLVVIGFDKIEKLLRRGGDMSLVHASGASADGCRKLDRFLKREQNGPETTGRVVSGFNADQLSLALGRPNVVHAALRNGASSQKFLFAVERLQQFRAGNAIDAAA
ncbi:MAG: RNA-binding protein [Alphaproteobacteria bacterium]